MFYNIQKIEKLGGPKVFGMKRYIEPHRNPYEVYVQKNSCGKSYFVRIPRNNPLDFDFEDCVAKISFDLREKNMIIDFKEKNKD